MDTFDDLLAPSRRVLEENPFEDPFAQPRSNSPDPWASFSIQPAEPSVANNDERLEVDDGRSSTLTTDSYATDEGNDLTDSLADPLESAARTEPDDHDNSLRVSPPTSPRTPGFKESIIPSAYSQTETIRALEPDEIVPPPLDLGQPSSFRQDLSTTDSWSPPSTSRAPIQFSPSSLVPSPPSKLENAVSPLEQPSASSGVRSFASLALGGESVGGWQGTQGEWTTGRSAGLPQIEKGTEGDEEIQDIVTDTLSDNKPPPPAEFAAVPSKTDKTGIQPVFIISVDDPQRVGDPIRAFIMYTVHTRTTSPLFQKSSFSVLRRYSDFLWLYETLSVNNPGVIVPPVPEKSPFGRFDDQFVQQRRVALEKCIQKAANHSVLGKDPDLKMFLESDSFALDIKHRKAEIAQERGGLMASIGQTIAGPRFHETDEWFDKQKGHLDSLESQLRGLVKAIEIAAKNKAEISLAMGEFAQTISELSSSDIGKQLSHSLSSMVEVERKAQDVQNIQAQQDMITIRSTADEYARLINSVRLAFSSRVRTYHAWQNADAEVKRVKQTHEKNRAQGRIPTDRLSHSLSLIAETERRALEAKHDFDKASKVIKTEMACFEQERIEDFKDSLDLFLEGMISRQKEVIVAWGNYQQLLLKKVATPAPHPVASSVQPSASF